MSDLHFEFLLQNHVKRIAVDGRSVVVGRAPESHVVVNLPWVQERHAVVDYSGEVLRIRAAVPGAGVKAGGRPIGTQWELIPSGTTIQLVGPRGLNLNLRVDVQARGPAMLGTGPAPDGQVPIDALGAEIVTDDVATAPGWFKGSAPAPQPAGGIPGHDLVGTGAPPAPTERRRQRLSREALLFGAVIGMMAAIVLALSWNAHRQAARRAQSVADARVITDQLQRATDLIGVKEYATARDSLDRAEALLRKHPTMKEEAQLAAELRASPAIQMGANGYVEAFAHWLKPDVALAWVAARQRDDPTIRRLKDRALAALAAGQLQEGLLACEDALTLIDAFPVKDHPDRSPLETTRQKIQNKLVEKDMLAKGMVLCNDRWMTPAEKFRIDQETKGLVEYQGRWLTRDEAFALQQKDKGLVLHQGKWVTAEQKYVADGLVQFEGKWMKPDERAAILAQREKERRDQLVLEQKRLTEQARVEQLKPLAYAKSQEFLRSHLKAPTAARFEIYRNANVTIVFTDGWYLVRAPVEVQNAVGAPMHKTYVCKLRPVAGGVWEEETTGILD